MHPATRDWKSFLYTVGSWLLPRSHAPGLIDIMQPVPLRPDNYWTDDINVCLRWYLSGAKARLYQTRA
jgi:hypothetical protein